MRSTPWRRRSGPGSCVSNRQYRNRAACRFVADTGKGIDPNVVDRIFNPLFTTKSNGMGMGLAICRSIIEGHDGRLWASAGAEGGSVFQFVLPADIAR